MSTTPTLRDALQTARDYGSAAWDDWLKEKVDEALAALTQGAGEAVEPVGVEPFGWYTSEYGDVDDIEWNSQRPTYEGDWRPLYCGVRLQQAVKRARQEGRDECRTACEELLALSARQAKDGDPFEIGREAAHTECIEAIRAKGTHD